MDIKCRDTRFGPSGIFIWGFPLGLPLLIYACYQMVIVLIASPPSHPAWWLGLVVLLFLFYLMTGGTRIFLEARKTAHTVKLVGDYCTIQKYFGTPLKIHLDHIKTLQRIRPSRIQYLASILDRSDNNRLLQLDTGESILLPARLSGLDIFVDVVFNKIGR